MADNSSASNIVKNLKGLDTSGVEVDEEQAKPEIGIDSPEEAALSAELEAALKAAGNEAAIAAPAELKLTCLRGRKYDVERAATLIPKNLDLRKQLLEDSDLSKLREDLAAHKVVYPGGKDADGRGIIWIRLRHHDPKASKAQDMGRLVMTVMNEALKDPDVQRMGVVVINDLNGLKLKVRTSEPWEISLCDVAVDA